MVQKVTIPLVDALEDGGLYQPTLVLYEEESESRGLVKNI